MSIYKKIYVIGTGAVANSCALCVKKAGEVVELIESRPATVPTCKQFCEKQGIAYQQLSGDVLKAFLLALNEPTLIISAANRYLFPKEVVEKNNITIVNYHGALLPKHPGRNAEAWAIYDGDKEAGITWHYVVPDVDAGSILIQKTTPITEQTTSFTLLRINSKLVMEGFEEILSELLAGTLTGTKQTERREIHYSWMKPNDGVLDLNWDAEKISAFLRAFDYGPLRTMGYPKVAVGGKEYEILSYKELMNLDKDSHNTIQINTEKSQLMIQRENKEFDMLVAETNCQIISELSWGG